MNCPRCNARVAFTKNRCDNCGQDLRDYRRVVSLSNAYYNKALEQAKVRDLSGAMESLNQSLQFNKMNTNARNLLGLIYCEIGEVVSALSEWVLSKHFQEKDNEAEYYIRKVQANPNKLESYNQTIKKYNTALMAAQNGDEDMAIIQLKKVVNTNPKFIRATQLLALLYMMSGKKENRIKALRLLKNIAKIDVTNTTTLRYMKELSDVHIKASDNNSEPKEHRNPGERKTLPRADVDAYKTITPYKEEKPFVLPFVNVMIGVIIGIAVMYFLIVPHMRASDASKANEDFKKYSENQASIDSNNSALKNQNETLQARVEELEKEILELRGGDNTNGQTLAEMYDGLLKAVRAYTAQDLDKTAQILSKINVEGFQSDTAKKVYQELSEASFEQASQKAFESGRDAYNGEGEFAGARDYDKAVELLEQALEYNGDNTDAMYFLGRCYQQLSKPDQAKEYYDKIINDYPDSSRVAEAASRLRELGY